MTERTQCPECHGHLKEPTKCRCGWIAPQAAQVSADPRHVPCAADENCRKPGRMWLEPYTSRQRVCVEHYYAELDKQRHAA